MWWFFVFYLQMRVANPVDQSRKSDQEIHVDRACLHSTRWPSRGFNTFFGIFFATKGGDLKIQDFKMEDSRRITTLLASAIPFGRARWPQRAAGLTLAHHPAKRRVEACKGRRHGLQVCADIGNTFLHLFNGVVTAFFLRFQTEISSPQTLPAVVNIPL